jgi:hypothetical protein
VLWVNEPQDPLLCLSALSGPLSPGRRVPVWPPCLHMSLQGLLPQV